MNLSHLKAPWEPNQCCGTRWFCPLHTFSVAPWLFQHLKMRGGGYLYLVWLRFSILQKHSWKPPFFLKKRRPVQDEAWWRLEISFMCTSTLWIFTAVLLWAMKAFQFTEKQTLLLEAIPQESKCINNSKPILIFSPSQNMVRSLYTHTQSMIFTLRRLCQKRTLKSRHRYLSAIDWAAYIQHLLKSHKITVIHYPIFFFCQRDFRWRAQNKCWIMPLLKMILFVGI